MPMPTLTEGLQSNQLALFLETNERVPLDRVTAFLDAVVDLAREQDGFENVEFELQYLKTGSVYAVLAGWNDVTSPLINFGIFAVTLATYLKMNTQRKAPRRAAEMVLDNGVVEIEILSGGGTPIKIRGKSMAAVQTVQELRKAGALGIGFDRETVPFGLTAGGSQLTAGSSPLTFGPQTDEVDAKDPSDVVGLEDRRQRVEVAGYFRDGRQGLRFESMSGDTYKVTLSGPHSDALPDQPCVISGDIVHSGGAPRPRLVVREISPLDDF